MFNTDNELAKWFEGDILNRYIEVKRNQYNLPEYALLKVRDCVEGLVAFTAKEINVSIGGCALFDAIRLLDASRSIKSYITEKFHIIRKKGNLGAHRLNGSGELDELGIQSKDLPIVVGEALEILRDVMEDLILCFDHTMSPTFVYVIDVASAFNHEAAFAEFMEGTASDDLLCDLAIYCLGHKRINKKTAEAQALLILETCSDTHLSSLELRLDILIESTSREDRRKLMRTLHLVSKIRPEEGESIFLASLYREDGDYKKALSYAKRSYKVMPSINSVREMAILLIGDLGNTMTSEPKSYPCQNLNEGLDMLEDAFKKDISGVIEVLVHHLIDPIFLKPSKAILERFDSYIENAPSPHAASFRESFSILKDHQFTADNKVIQVVLEKKPGRNDPCSCGSGKKTKKCCS
jgi:hypothetical protein